MSVEIVTRDGVSRIYRDGVEQCSKFGAFTPAEAAAIGAKPAEPPTWMWTWLRLP